MKKIKFTFKFGTKNLYSGPNPKRPNPDLDSDIAIPIYGPQTNLNENVGREINDGDEIPLRLKA